MHGYVKLQLLTTLLALDALVSVVLSKVSVNNVHVPNQLQEKTTGISKLSCRQTVFPRNQEDYIFT